MIGPQRLQGWLENAFGAMLALAGLYMILAGADLSDAYTLFGVGILIGQGAKR